MVGSSVGEISAGEFVNSLLDNAEGDSGIVALSVGSVCLHIVKKKTFQQIGSNEGNIYEFFPYFRTSGTILETHLVQFLEISWVR